MQLGPSMRSGPLSTAAISSAPSARPSSVPSSEKPAVKRMAAFTPLSAHSLTTGGASAGATTTMARSTTSGRLLTDG